MDGRYIGGDHSPSVTCTPSDSRAPVRWRPMFGIRDFQVSLSPPGLNHSLSFPSVYRITPDRTEVFICDLINVELSNDAPVSPQNVTVRFIQGEHCVATYMQ